MITNDKELIKTQMEIRLLTQMLQLSEKGLMDTDEYRDLQRKKDVMSYGVDIQELIDKL